MGRARRDYGEAEQAAGTTPERTCAVTRAKLSPAELIRFVRAPDGTITPDLGHRLPGRGVWVSIDRGAVEKAVSQNAFARSLKTPVRAPDGLADLVERLLLERCIQALALANKAGHVVAGFAKVESAIATGRVAALVHASDAAPDGVAKLTGKLRARLARATAIGSSDANGKLSAPGPSPRDAEGAPSGSTCPLQEPLAVNVLSSRDLSLALGRENVVHAAVIQGGAARYFLTEVERLGRYRSSTPSNSAAAGRPPRIRSNTEQA